MKREMGAAKVTPQAVHELLTDSHIIDFEFDEDRFKSVQVPALHAQLIGQLISSHTPKPVSA